MTQVPTTQATEVRYTAHVVKSFREAIAAGSSDIIRSIGRLLDACDSPFTLPRFTLARLAAVLIIIQEFSNHLSDSGAVGRGELDRLHRRATAGLRKAMAGRTIDELNTDEYKPAEGGEWRVSDRNRLHQDKVTGKWIASEGGHSYRFRTAVQEQVSEQFQAILSRGQL